MFKKILFGILLWVQMGYSAPTKGGICLTLLVKNDESVIEASLASVKNLIDCVAVCDVGSSDQTLEKIEKFGEEEGIDVKTVSHPWKSFAHNRGLAVQFAQRVLGKNGFSLARSYILVLDADMVLQGTEGFSVRGLDADAYLIADKSAALCSFRYTPHLLLAARQWESSGFAGEYWSVQGSFRSVKLKTLMIESQGQGEIYEAKKDLPTLRECQSQEPGNPQYAFYLAQIERCQSNLAEAIDLYKTRLEQGGDAEEVWFSKYMLGKCYEGLNEWGAALDWYLEAYQQNPSRTESLIKVATYYRWLGKNELAYLFAKHGTRIPQGDDQLLFDVSLETGYQFDEELSIASYYTGFREDGHTAISNLVLRKNVPWSVKQQGYQNLVFYSQNLPRRHVMPIDIVLPPINEGSEERYRHSNPSICKTKDGYNVICRAVNYTQVGARDFTTNDERGVFRTKNFLLHYDANWQLLSCQEILDNPSRAKIRSCNVEGLEDCRLVEVGEKLWFTCTTSDTNPTGQRQISLCRLGKGDGRTVAVEKLIPLLGPDPYRCEKNWLPFVKEGKIHLMYSYDPLIIYQPDIGTGQCETVVSEKPAYDLSHFRGSAGSIPFEDGSLVLVHEVLQQSDFQRIYFHRFVYYDQQGKIKKVSKPFTFQHFGVEFCCGMTLDHQGNELILSVGIEDREAALYFVSLKTIQELLYALP
jgi:glycosyltransferase involved in cell wall biosynthesis